MVVKIKDPIVQPPLHLMLKDSQHSLLYRLVSIKVGPGDHRTTYSARRPSRRLAIYSDGAVHDD